AIRAQDIEDYIAHRRNQGVSNATVNRELACLKRMYNLAIKWGEVKRNPVHDVDFLEEPPGRTRFLSEQECRRLIECSPDHMKPIILTALCTGMRLGEILSLQWEQVRIDDVVDPHIEVIHTKNNKKRFIPLNDDMVDLLSSFVNDSRYVFLGTKGKPLKSVRKPFSNALKKASIPDFRFHDLRHTFSSHYIMNGGDLLSLKETLGHSNLKMVERYAHLAAAHKRKQVNNLTGKFTICHLSATSPKIHQKAFKKQSPVNS
ncbi:hypothetical protein BVY01_02025, partial [bacterium I07]